MINAVALRLTLPLFWKIKISVNFFLLFLYLHPCAQSPLSSIDNKVAQEFTALLERPKVDFKPSFQIVPSDSLLIEKGFIYSEANEKVPILIYKPITGSSRSFPVVICLHGTGGSKEKMNQVMYRFTSIGIMAVAIDARYHGERIIGGAHGSTEYIEAITIASKNSDPKKQQHPFLFDTVYDLWRLTDYLITRPDVQGTRIGMMGISMGGIETWLAASVDKRIKVIAPVIAAQSFRWSLENNKWQGRARTIWPVHERMAKERGDTNVTVKNAETVWNKLIPGITGPFDCPSMIRLIAPRPLLLLNNEKDENCPLPGAQLAFSAATDAYRSQNALDKLKIHITPEAPHRFTDEHLEMVIEWFAKWL